MIVALTRPVPLSIDRGERTHVERVEIDYAAAAAQHSAYQEALRGAGCEIVELGQLDAYPDSVFVEDTAVILEEFALITRPGAASRRGETPSVEAALEDYRTIRVIDPPATIDGGDVIVAGRTVFVGLSTRTNSEGAEQLRNFCNEWGYTVREVVFEGCLHLKSAATSVSEDTMLINPEWVREREFPGFRILTIDEKEPFAANALSVNQQILFPSSFPRTAERLRTEGYDVRMVDVSELAKAEGALTCCSLLVVETD